MLTVKKLRSELAYGANTYLISSGGESCVIDPACSFDGEVECGKPKYVLLTHSHFDHILRIDDWVDRGYEVLIAKEELGYLPSGELNCYKIFFGEDKGYRGKARGLTDGDVIRLGEDELVFRRTPGHTPGSGIYISGRFAFVGDTVFEGGGYGRWDLPGGSYAELVGSIEFIKSLDEDTVLFPGHGDHTTVRDYKRDYRR